LTASAVRRHRLHGALDTGGTGDGRDEVAESTRSTVIVIAAGALRLIKRTADARMLADSVGGMKAIRRR